MDPYDLLIHGDAIEIYKKSRGESRRQIRQLFDLLSTHPFVSYEHSYQDLKGRSIYKHHVLGYVIDFTIDHPVKEVKILEITKL